MYPPTIAEQLCRRGHDAAAVTARPELRMLADPDLFAIAQQERRAVVTENVADFARIADGCDQRGGEHHGIVLLDSRRYPRGNLRTIGRVVEALERLLEQYPRDDATSLRHWL